jgi:3-dehydroquinate synthetase
LISKFTSLWEIQNLEKSILVKKLKTDKKVKNGKITFVVIEKPGITKFIKCPIDENLEKDLNEVFIN